MIRLNKACGSVVAAALLFAAPAAAATAEGGQERGRTGRVAKDIARGIEEAADAVGTVVDAVDQSLDTVRFNRAERFAIGRCAERVERYGRMRVENAEPYGRRSIRVHGTVARDWGESRYGYRERSFTCTVRDDGRVRLRTRRLR